MASGWLPFWRACAFCGGQGEVRRPLGTGVEIISWWSFRCTRCGTDADVTFIRPPGTPPWDDGKSGLLSHALPDAC